VPSDRLQRPNGHIRNFVIDDEVRHMINKRTSTFLLRQRARELGMRTLREDGVRKVLAGLTSADEVISSPGRRELSAVN
jgi:type II secretory ATPase GspE/PulE/Tfp pilus assembly ATPase PilB-like protein